jgi:hypothetical protein
LDVYGSQSDFESHVNFTHDFNPGNGPEVSTVDSGNGFGAHVFWTAVIPDSAVQINPLAGTVRLHVRDLPELDYYSPEGTGDLASLGPTWQTGYFDSTVSIDVVWNRPVTRLVHVRDTANGFAGIFAENQATVRWSANSGSGFSFTSNPGDFSTSVPEVPGVNGVTAPLNFFAQVGFERNGVFFPHGPSPEAAGVLGAFAVAPVATRPSIVVRAVGERPSTDVSWGLLVSSAGASALDQRVATLGYSGHATSRASDALWSVSGDALQHVFADWETGTLWAFGAGDTSVWA